MARMQNARSPGLSRVALRSAHILADSDRNGFYTDPAFAVIGSP